MLTNVFNMYVLFGVMDICESFGLAFYVDLGLAIVVVPLRGSTNRKPSGNRVQYDSDRKSKKNEEESQSSIITLDSSSATKRGKNRKISRDRFGPRQQTQ